uniref:GPI transamidase component PIG-S n=1 Tax=Acrobeloides nanus TaxID=290746 RepID=A0A914E1N1_9BILA
MTRRSKKLSNSSEKNPVESGKVEENAENSPLLDFESPQTETSSETLLDRKNCDEDKTIVEENSRDAEILKQVMTEYEAEELRYRCISFYAYLVVIVVIGVPIWWLTTTPYRAALENFDPSVKIHIPLQVRMYYDQKSTEEFLKRISKLWLENELSPFSYDVPLRLSYDFELKYQENLLDFIRSPNANGCEVELVFLEESEFDRLKANRQSEILITHGRYILPIPKNLVDSQNLYERVRRIIYEEVLDINRLSMIMQRERMNEQEKEEFKPIKPDIAVWEDISISPNYNVHVIFIHDDPGVQPRSSVLESKITDTIERLANLLTNTTHISLSWEHFWDFALENFVRQEKNFSYIPFGSISDFVTEVDRYSAAIEAPNPTFKLAVIYSEHDIGLVDEKNLPANSISVASWGGIVSTCITCPNQAKNPNAGVLDVLRSLLGLRKILPGGFTRLSDSVNDLSWQRLRLHAYVENQLRARHFVRAIHEMTSKISDLVVSDEVAALVRDSIGAALEANDKTKENFCVDTYSSAKARIFAERAANHPSLLEYLNFPWSQKYAIYLPLFFPVLLPTVEGVNSLVRAFMQRRRSKL